MRRYLGCCVFGKVSSMMFVFCEVFIVFFLVFEDILCFYF